MKNSLITFNDIKKEEFNSLCLRVSNVSQFLAYYTLLLTTASQYGLISDSEAQKISNLILKTFMKNFEFDNLIIRNNMYVLTLFLKSMDNLTQLETLTKVSNYEEALTLFNKANIWFSKKIKLLKLKVSSLKPKILNIKNQILTNSFDEIICILNEASTYSISKTMCDFKKLHNSSIILKYSFLHSDKLVKKENYLEEMEFVVNSFEKEICILFKLNPKEIMKNLQISSKEALDSVIYDNIIDESSINIELEDLENEYQKKLNKAENSSNTFDEALEQLEIADREIFKKMHPELTGEEFEYAFEDWQFSLPDSHFAVAKLLDANEIKREYEEKREILLKKLENLDKTSATRVLETKLSQEIEISLEVILKMMAMFELFKINPSINLPKTNEELLKALETLELSSALKVIEKTIKPILSKAELSYLKGN